MFRRLFSRSSRSPAPSRLRLDRGPRRRFLAFSFAGLLLAAAGVSPARAAKLEWEPVSPAERAIQAEGGAREAGAEVLFPLKELRVFYQVTKEFNYRRIKIHEERAVETLGKLELLSRKDQRVEDLAARITRPDGSSVDVMGLKMDEHRVASDQQRNWRTRQLVIPGLAAGDIVDVQWLAVDLKPYSGYRYFSCQEVMPVRRFELKLNNYSANMNLAWFQAPTARLERKGATRVSLTVTDLPAYVTEPAMPAPFELRAMILLVYGEVPKDAGELWTVTAERLQERLLSRTSGRGGLKAMVDKLGARTGSEEERLRRLYAFCQKEIFNVSFDESPASAAYRKEDRWLTPADILRARRGLWAEIGYLFAALCMEAGFEVRLLGLAERDELMSIRFSHGMMFMDTQVCAVKTPVGWKFFDLGCRFLPFGMLRWENEGLEALVSDRKKASFMEIPVAAPSQSRRVRRGSFVMDADGMLRGDVEETRTGHLATNWRLARWKDTPEKLERAVRDELVALVSSVQVDGIEIEGLMGSDEPLVIRYRLEIPAYAHSAGERLLMQPGIFHQNSQPRFRDTKRVHDIVFDHA